MIPFSFALVYSGLIGNYTRFKDKTNLDIICLGHYKDEEFTPDEMPFEASNASVYVRGIRKFPKTRTAELSIAVLKERLPLLEHSEPQMAVSRFHTYLKTNKEIAISDEQLHSLEKIIVTTRDPYSYIAEALVMAFCYQKELTIKEAQYVAEFYQKLCAQTGVENLFAPPDSQNSQHQIIKANPSALFSALCQLGYSADYVSYGDDFWHSFGIVNTPSAAKTRAFLRYYLHELFKDTIDEDIGIIALGINRYAQVEKSILRRREYYLKNSFYLNHKMGVHYYPFIWMDEVRKKDSLALLNNDENRVIKNLAAHLNEVFFQARNSPERTTEALTTEIHLLCNIAEKQFPLKDNISETEVFFDEKKYGPRQDFNLKARTLQTGEWHSTCDNPSFELELNAANEDDYSYAGVPYDFELYYKNTTGKTIKAYIRCEIWPRIMDHFNKTGEVYYGEFIEEGIGKYVDLESSLNVVLDCSDDLFLRLKELRTERVIA